MIKGKLLNGLAQISLNPDATNIGVRPKRTGRISNWQPEWPPSAAIFRPVELFRASPPVRFER